MQGSGLKTDNGGSNAETSVVSGQDITLLFMTIGLPVKGQLLIGTGWWETVVNIRERRKQLGLTLEEVGKKVGVSRSTVLKWENGKIKNMTVDKVASLSNVLQVAIIDLIPNRVVTKDG